jgi:hypothetical protein
MAAMPGTAHRSPAPSILQSFRRRATGRLRAVVLSVFALGIASQSLLGTLNSIHELTSPAHTAHGVTSHMAEHDHEAAVRDGTDADEGGPLHVLLHHTHCCSHSVWMTGDATVIAVMAELRADPTFEKPRALPAPERTALFRPPIAV